MFQKPTEDLNLSMFNMIIGINELETLIKHTSYDCKSKFDGRKCDSYQSGIMINVNVSVKVWENIMCDKKIIFGILLHVVEQMVNI